MEPDLTVKAVLGDRHDILFVLLFGSTVRGKRTGMSDVDIGLFFDSVPDLLETGVLSSRLEQALHKPVDLVTLNGLPISNPSVAFQIATTGRAVMVRDRAALVDFKTKACLHYMDTRLLREAVQKRLGRRIENGNTGMRDYV